MNKVLNRQQKEGMRVPLDEGNWDINDLNNYIMIDLEKYKISQASSMKTFAQNCVTKGPLDIVTLLVLGSPSNYIAYYSTSDFDKTKYLKPSTTDKPSQSSSQSSSQPSASTPLPTPISNSTSVSISISTPIKKIGDPTLKVKDRVMDDVNASDTTVYEVAEIIHKRIDIFNAIYQYKNDGVLNQNDGGIKGSMDKNKYYDTNPTDGSISVLPKSENDLGGWNPSGNLLKFWVSGDQSIPPPVESSLPLKPPPSSVNLPSGTKSLPDSTLKIDDLITDGYTAYKISNLVDKTSDPVRAYTTYNNDASYVANGSNSMFATTLSDAASNSKIYDTNSDDSAKALNVTGAQNSDGSIAFKNWNPSGYFLWVDLA